MTGAKDADPAWVAGECDRCGDPMPAGLRGLCYRCREEDARDPVRGTKDPEKSNALDSRKVERNPRRR